MTTQAADATARTKWRRARTHHSAATRRPYRQSWMTPPGVLVMAYSKHDVNEERTRDEIETDVSLERFLNKFTGCLKINQTMTWP